MTDLVGTVVHHHTVTRLWWTFDRLETYEALSSAFGDRVALEVHDPFSVAQAENALRSARYSSLLNDTKAVIAPIDVGKLDDGRPYIVRATPKTGGRLVELLDGPLAVPRALALVRDLATALDTIHGRGYAVGKLRCETVYVEDTSAGEHVRLFDLRYAIAEHVTDAHHQKDLQQCATILYELVTGTRVTNPSTYELRRVPKPLQAFVEQAFDGEFETAEDFAAALARHPAAAPNLPAARLIDKP